MEKLNEENKYKKIVIKYEKFSIWRIFAYFIIYSFLGFIIETIFSIITTGKLESRQSFLYGPFCCIYGVGAVIMLVSLQFFKKNNNRLFWGGFLVGSVVEYFISLIGEVVFHTIWWDYSDMPLNLNGRICFFFSIFWGLLAIYLITYVNPKIDKLINKLKEKISIKTLKVFTIIAIVLLFLDWIISSIALELFFVRKVYEFDLDVYKKDKYIETYEKIYSNQELTNFIQKFWNDEKMIKTQPNLKLQLKNGKILYFTELHPEIQPYLYQFDMTWRDELTNKITGKKIEPKKDYQ